MKKRNDPGVPGSDHTDSIALEIRKAREARGLSFTDLSRLTGVSRTTLHDYESGRSKPGAKELLRLCEALEVTPNRLLLGVESPYGGAGGVLLPLVEMARSAPEKALGLSVIILPLVATTLAQIGNESLVALATMADETFRARDPERFFHFSKLIAEFESFDFSEYKKLPEDEQKKRIAEIQARVEAYRNWL